jgi:hypothetical protein
MGLAPIEVHIFEDLPRSKKVGHVFEAYGQPIGFPSEQPVTTIVAVENYYDDEVKDWAAYWLPFNGDDTHAQFTPQRAEIVRRFGTKIPKDVACAMFPRLDPEKYRE